MSDDKIDLRKQGEGRYLAYAENIRIGFVIGGKSSWNAELLDGTYQGTYTTKKNAYKSLFDIEA